MSGRTHRSKPLFGSGPSHPQGSEDTLGHHEAEQTARSSREVSGAALSRRPSAPAASGPSANVRCDFPSLHRVPALPAISQTFLLLGYKDCQGNDRKTCTMLRKAFQRGSPGWAIYLSSDGLLHHVCVLPENATPVVCLKDREPSPVRQGHAQSPQPLRTSTAGSAAQAAPGARPRMLPPAQPV